MKILVSGLLNIETTVPVRKFPIDYYPIDYPFFGITSNVSGVGYNITKALKTLGDEVVLNSFLGNDPEAERILDQLVADGIGIENIHRRLCSSPVSAVLYDPQGKRQIYCDLKDIQEQTLDEAALDRLLVGCDAAVMCNIEFNRQLIKEARARGVLTATDVHVLDSADNEYNRDFMMNADILFMSDENLPCPPADFIKKIYERYRNRIIVIGMGKEGAMLYEDGRGEPMTVPAYCHTEPKNTVGAGDSLFSSFLHFYLKSGDALSSLQRAVVFAGVKIGFSGASVGFISDEETERIFGTIHSQHN